MLNELNILHKARNAPLDIYFQNKLNIQDEVNKIADGNNPNRQNACVGCVLLSNFNHLILVFELNNVLRACINNFR